MKSVLHFSLKVLIILLCVNAGAHAKDIAVNAISMPPLIKNSQEGIIVDRVARILECANFTHSITLKPWKRSFRDTKETGGALIPTMYTEERAAFFWYPDQPIYQVRYLFFQKKGGGLTWDGDYNKLQHLSIAKLRGGAVGPEFDEFVKSGKLEIIEATDFEQLLRLVVYGRVDLIAADKETIEFIATGLQLNDAIEVINGPEISSRDIFIAFNLNELTADEQKIINQCHKDIAETN